MPHARQFTWRVVLFLGQSACFCARRWFLAGRAEFPDAEARREMLALHLKGRPVATDLDLGGLSETLDGYSASDLRFLVDEAARDAFKRLQDITNESFRFAMSRVQRSVTPEIEVEYRSIEQRGF
ncbi:MAG: hypothetical protein WB676_32320 [Bryobacteraceae bacterium]